MGSQAVDSQAPKLKAQVIVVPKIQNWWFDTVGSQTVGFQIVGSQTESTDGVVTDMQKRWCETVGSQTVVTQTGGSQIAGFHIGGSLNNVFPLNGPL